MQKLIGRLDAINRNVGLVVRWAAILMVLIQFAIVLFRYVFGFSSIAVNESVLYLHSTLFMLGAGYTLLVDDHVRVDIFYANSDIKRKATIDIFGHLVLLIPSMAILAYWSWPSVANSWKILEGPISVGGIPASFLLKSLIPAFCGLLIIQSISCLLANILRRRGEAL
ncbi:TRAP transporter small permease subunit [Ahrensia kielensis]|uniref:TRAP transporter small permease protein n=1 Tax=Ahrensia kielensis TaxID=76980 RepID=A0ABU9TAD0_9HYPH|nr:TRAP transporter small permease subunit [Ahrensia sp. 13_GOM-1096m]